MKSGHVFYRSLRKDYPVIERGKGVFVWDTRGKRYLDGASGCLVTNIGYGAAPVAEALREEALKTGFAHGTMFTSLPQEELARLLAGRAPASLQYVYFVSGGTEANETAFSLALQYHRQRGNNRKWKIIGRRLSYHGSSLATLSAAGNVQRRGIYSPLVMPFPLVPAPHCYRCYYELAYPSCGIRCARELEHTILTEGPDNIAAFICEPVIGTSAAASVPPPEYFPLVREICDRCDVLLIADEVLCGYGRSGRYLALDHWGVTADLVTLGKGIGGGYAPLGAVLIHEKVRAVFSEHWGRFIHGYTYQGNPVSCAAGVAVNRYLRENGLFEQVAPKGEYLKERLQDLAARHEIIGDVRGIGLLLGLELVQNRSTRESFDPSFGVGEGAREAAMEEGLILYTGVGGTADIVPRDYLIVAPPFIITREETDLLLELLEITLSKVTATLP